MNTVDCIAERTLEEARLKRDAESWRRLRRFCGYIENGSDTVVHLSQDDATRDWVFSIGERSFYGKSPEAALGAAVNELGDPE